jgi:hypothetical protein
LQQCRARPHRAGWTPPMHLSAPGVCNKSRSSKPLHGIQSFRSAERGRIELGHHLSAPGVWSASRYVHLIEMTSRLYSSTMQGRSSSLAQCGYKGCVYMDD